MGLTDTSATIDTSAPAFLGRPTAGGATVHHYPKIIRAPELDRAVWAEVVDVLCDPGYLTSLAREHLADNSTRFRTRRNHSDQGVLVELVGFEPMIPSLRMRCSWLCHARRNVSISESMYER